MSNKMEMAKQLLNKTRDKEEINLVDKVVELMKKHKFTDEATNIFTKDQLITNCYNNVFEVQRVNINRFWTKQLMHIGAKSIEARSFLLQDGTLENWLDFFERILPMIKENGIPKIE